MHVRLLTLLVLALPPAGVLHAPPATAQTAAPSLTLSIPAESERRQISVVVKPGLKQSGKLPAALRTAREKMQAGEEIAEQDLRALADRWDGLAAQKYVRVLLPRGMAQNASEIAYFASIAVSTGRVWTLPEAVEAMRLLDPQTEPAARKRTYIAMLYAHAWAGNSVALDAVIDFNGEGRLFGPLSEKTRARILAQGDKNGDGRAALRLALRLLDQAERTPAETALLQAYLARAKAGNTLAVQATAANLLVLLQAETGAVVPIQ